jgi:hypothetical protein
MQAISRLLESWRVLVVLGVLAALSIPVCHWTGALDHALVGPFAAPFAMASPLTSLMAFVIARSLWRRERQGRATASSRH